MLYTDKIVLNSHYTDNSGVTTNISLDSNNNIIFNDVNGASNTIRVASVTMTSAQITNNTQVVVIPAPPVGYCILPLNITAHYIYSITGYTGSGVLRFGYGTTTGSTTNVLSNAQLTGTQDYYAICPYGVGTTSTAIITTYLPLNSGTQPNQQVFCYINGTLTGGSGTIDIKFYYILNKF